MSIISINKLKFKYNEKLILKDITFKIKIPSLVSIVGPNNSGKSTFIKCLAGIVPTEDIIAIDDISLSKKNIRKYSRNIGTIFSLDKTQFLFERVIDELTFPLCNLNYSKKKMHEKINQISKILFLKNIINKKISDLSDFEKLKVLVAVNIIHDPKVLLVDDILVGLDNEDKEKILLMLKRIIRELGIIVIMTTSSLQDAIYSDAILVIEDGVVRYSGRLSEILEHDNALTRMGIEIPIMMDMSLKLKFYNLLDKVILNEEEMVDVLWD